MNKNKKIAVLVINCLQGGGAERSVLTLGKGFFEIGYEVHIIRFKDFVEYDLDERINYHVVRFKPYKLIPNKKLSHKIFSKNLDSYILREIGSPNIVLSNEYADRIMQYSKLPNLMYIIRCMLSNKYNWNNFSEKNKNIIRERYEVFPCVCISKGVQQDFISNISEKSETTVIYNAFDKEDIRFLSNSFNIDKVKNLEANKYLLHVGSFKYEKAHEILIKSYAKTTMEYPLVLLGQGKLFDNMKKLTKELGINEKVFFLGFDKNPYPYIKNARGLVLSSRSEGFGRVILEAISLDTPVISTNCNSGPSELLPIQNLVPVDNVEALTAKMNDIFLNPKDFIVEFDDKFLPKNIAQEYVNYITEFKTTPLTRAND